MSWAQASINLVAATPDAWPDQEHFVVLGSFGINRKQGCLIAGKEMRRRCGGPNYNRKHCIGGDRGTSQRPDHSAAAESRAPDQLALDDLDRHVGQAFELAEQHIALHDGPDIFGRAGIDDVAGFQLEGFRSFCDLLGHAPDHLFEIGILPHRAVDGERDRAFGEVADLADRMDRVENGGGRHCEEQSDEARRTCRLGHRDR
jgi:hypothetical protein